MRDRTKIFAISGSTRANSTSETILRLIAELYPDSVELQIYKGIAELPHFNPDTGDDELAQSVRDFRNSIAESDAVLISTPEYVFSLPGSLKNALEWTVSTMVFSGKPAALIVASGIGEKAYESLLLIMKTIGALIPGAGSLLISGARSKFSTLPDESVIAEIRRVVDALLQAVPSKEFSHQS